jgi:hypothetical protein
VADTPQPPSAEATWLRQNWNRDAIGQHEQKWIAVKEQQVIASARNLDELLRATIAQNPLYAFVYFGPLQ